MNILFLSPNIPDSFSRIRALNIIKALSKKHSLHLITFIEREGEKKKIGDIKKYFKNIETVKLPKWKSYFNCAVNLVSLSQKPFRVSYFHSKKMHEKVAEIIERENIDLIYAKRKRMAQYAENLSGVKKVLDLTDCMALLYQRSLKIIPLPQFPLYWLESKKLAFYEPRIAEKFDRVFVCSKLDKFALEELAGKKLRNIRIVPNVVDTDSFIPSKHGKPDTILLSGIMHAFANIDAALFFSKEILPLVLERTPDAKLSIVGPKPSQKVKALSSNNIVVTGRVPDLRQHIANASVVVVPLRCGAGTRNKILQAAALGKPVVSTPLGAEGLEGLQENKNIMIASSPKEFADKTVLLLQNAGLRKELGANARIWVKSNYSLKTLEKILDRELPL